MAEEIGCENQSESDYNPRAWATDQKQSQRPQQVELLLDGERPEVTGNERSPCQVTKEKYAGHDVPRLQGKHSHQTEHRDAHKIDQRRRQDAQSASSIKSTEVDATFRVLLFQQKPSDQIPRQHEEDIDAELPVEDERVGRRI